MPALLPELSRSELARRLAAVAPPLAAGSVEGLHHHYLELRRWAAHTSLIGPGTVEEVVERHYGEALASLPEVALGGVLLDVGSGAGFPGLVLAACRPELDVTLVEANARKVAFLRHAAYRMGASARVVEAFLGATLPPGVPERLDFLTLRAVRLQPAAWRLLVARLVPGGRVLLWGGPASEVPPGLDLIRTVPLQGAVSRTLSVLAHTGVRSAGS